MSNEVKIGLLAIVTIALAFWGYKFILGNNILVKTNSYQVLYDDVSGLQIGTDVKIHGVDVGTVAKVELLPGEKEQVLVILDLEKDIKIPKDTRAVIATTSFMGSMDVMLKYDKPCSGADCAENGSFLEGEMLGLIGTMVGTDNLELYIEKLEKTLIVLLDSIDQKLLGVDSQNPLAKTLRNLDATTGQLSVASASLNRMLNKEIKETLGNLENLTTTLDENKGALVGILNNADTLTSQLAAADLDETLSEFQNTLEDLQKTLSAATNTLDGVSAAVDGISKGEGTLGKLMKDDELYYSLQRLISSADSLSDDLKNRPYKYVPFKSRKKVKRFERLDAKEEAANNN